jgi:citrate lyase subunit beta/citryl-CoA lyase
MHPSEVLFQGSFLPVSIPVCDHYAGSEKLMRKSLQLQQEMGPVFDITFDCEDGASHGAEQEHAHLIGTLLAGEDNKFERIGARVHDVTSPFFEQDIEIILAHAAKRIAYLVVPKVDSVADVKSAITLVNRHAKRHGRAKLPVHVLIETHGALKDAHYGAIPASAMRSPGQFTHPLVMRAKLEIAAACHAYGKTPSHNVTTEINDTSVVASDAHHAASECGYTRMWSIHPNQIKPIVKSFAPRVTEVNEAAAILSEAQAAQWGPIQHHGKLHDRASYRYYWTVLQRARTGGVPLPEGATALLYL